MENNVLLSMKLKRYLAKEEKVLCGIVFQAYRHQGIFIDLSDFRSLLITIFMGALGRNTET